MSKEEKEKKNKRIGIFVSAGSHIAIILLFIFLVAWRAPNPPLPEFGIELNFGTSDVGTGDIQPETTAAESETEEDAAPDAAEEVAEEIVEESATDAAEEAEDIQEEVVEAETVQEEIAPVTETPSEDAIKEPEEKTVEEKPLEAKLVEQEKKEDPKPPKVLYPGNKEGAAGTSGENKTPATGNQGDKTDAVGDQGDEEGNVDARALYGKPGGGGGSSLEMTGWTWDSAPDPKENTAQSGKIVFELTIDERGEVTSAKAISYTVSASLVRIYQAEVEKLTFSKTSFGPAPPTSKGKITFIIKAK